MQSWQKRSTTLRGKFGENRSQARKIAESIHHRTDPSHK
jgi:hypothetical protein